MKAVFLIVSMLGLCFLLVILGSVIIGIVEQVINQAHAWEEWRHERQDDRKGKDI